MIFTCLKISFLLAETLCGDFINKIIDVTFFFFLKTDGYTSEQNANMLS